MTIVEPSFTEEQVARLAVVTHLLEKGASADGAAYLADYVLEGPNVIQEAERLASVFNGTEGPVKQNDEHADEDLDGGLGRLVLGRDDSDDWGSDFVAGVPIDWERDDELDDVPFPWFVLDADPDEYDTPVVTHLEGMTDFDRAPVGTRAAGELGVIVKREQGWEDELGHIYTIMYSRRRVLNPEVYWS